MAYEASWTGGVCDGGSSTLLLTWAATARKAQRVEGANVSDPSSCYVFFVTSCGVWDLDAGPSPEDSTEVSTI